MCHHLTMSRNSATLVVRVVSPTWKSAATDSADQLIPGDNARFLMASRTARITRFANAVYFRLIGVGGTGMPRTKPAAARLAVEAHNPAARPVRA